MNYIDCSYSKNYVVEYICNAMQTLIFYFLTQNTVFWMKKAFLNYVVVFPFLEKHIKEVFNCCRTHTIHLKQVSGKHMEIKIYPLYIPVVCYKCKYVL